MYNIIIIIHTGALVYVIIMATSVEELPWQHLTQKINKSLTTALYPINRNISWLHLDKIV